MEKITRKQAQKLQMSNNCRYGIISDGCQGVWAQGRSELSVIRSAKKYFRRENYADYLDARMGNQQLTLSAWLDGIIADCKILVVV